MLASKLNLHTHESTCRSTLHRVNFHANGLRGCRIFPEDNSSDELYRFTADSEWATIIMTTLARDRSNSECTSLRRDRKPKCVPLVLPWLGLNRTFPLVNHTLNYCLDGGGLV